MAVDILAYIINVLLTGCLYTHLNCLNGNPEWFSKGVILKGIYQCWYAPSWYFFFFNLNVTCSARNNLCLRYLEVSASK